MTKSLPLILFISLFTISDNVNAQGSMSDFLLTAFEDLNTKGYDASINFLSPKNYRLPIVEDLEVRFGNDEFTQKDQQYAVRFRPGNPWKIRRNKALFNATKKELSIRQQLQYHENLVDRYELAAEYLLETKSLDLEQRKYALIKKRIDILGSNLESALFNSKDFVEAKLDQVDALNSKEETTVSILNLERIIVSVLQQPEINWNSEQLISISGMDSIADEIASKSLPALELELITQKIDVARKEVRLEKADFDIGYFQTEYYPYRDRNSDYGLSFGISIPIFNSNKNQIAEKKLDEIELRNDFAAEQYQDSIKRVVEYEYLKSLLAQHRMLIEQIEDLELDKLSSNLRQIEDNNPLTFLDLEEGKLKLEELKLKSYSRVIDQYLEFLDAYNVITNLPLRNYLSKDLSNLE